MCFCRSGERSESDNVLLMEKAQPLPMGSREAQKGPFRKRRKRRKKDFLIFETQKGAERALLVGWVTHAPCHADLVGGWLDLLLMLSITLACIQAVFCFEIVLA